MAIEEGIQGLEETPKGEVGTNPCNIHVHKHMGAEEVLSGFRLREPYVYLNL